MVYLYDDVTSATPYVKIPDKAYKLGRLKTHAQVLIGTKRIPL